jgi:hypothetical protein
MATPNPSIGDIVATTIENRSKKAADNITRNNALLNRMNKRGTAKPFSGGRTLWQELEYAQNSTAMWYSGYEQINVQPSQIFTAAEFPIRQAAVAVSISGLEELQNSGPEQMIDLIAGRVNNADNTLQALIAVGIYSNGSQPKEIGGLQQLVAATPTNTVGGIDSNTWAFWKNISYGAITDGGAATTSANIRRYMDTIYPQMIRGTDKPDLLVADNTTWRLFNESMQPLQRITNASMAEAGFVSLEYMGAPVVLDGGFQGYAGADYAGTNGSDYMPLGGVPSGYLYFLNTRYIQFRPHRDRNFVPLNPDRYSINQDAVVKLMAWAGNMTVSNRRMQAVLYPS